VKAIHLESSEKSTAALGAAASPPRPPPGAAAVGSSPTSNVIGLASPAPCVRFTNTCASPSPGAIRYANHWPSFDTTVAPMVFQLMMSCSASGFALCAANSIVAEGPKTGTIANATATATINRRRFALIVLLLLAGTLVRSSS
jgi:hypothetical protein